MAIKRRIDKLEEQAAANGAQQGTGGRVVVGGYRFYMEHGLFEIESQAERRKILDRFVAAAWAEVGPGGEVSVIEFVDDWRQ